jgi:hypothetical protein
VVDLKAQYTLKVSAGNRVAGFRLAADASTSSSFIVQVDEFKIVKSDNTGTIVPFSVDGTGVYMNNAYIRNIEAEKILAGTINAALSINSPTITGGTLTGGTLNIGSGTFKVDSNGRMTASAAQITGEITSTKGNIGGWTIGSSTITGGALTLNSNGSITGSTNFSVSPSGILTATSANLSSAAVSGTVTAGAGSIGGWTIGASTLTGGSTTLNSNGTLTVSTLNASSGGSIGGWTIGASSLTGGSTTLNSNGTLTVSTLNANSGGSIGGWTIGASSLTGGSTTLNSNGTITCANLTANTAGTIGGWTIGASTLTGGSTTLNSNGTITCANLQASTGGTIGGWTIGSTTLTGGNITLSSAGNVYAGMTGYDTGTGWYLANDGKFSVGNSGGNKLVWDGSKLKVTGGIYVTDSIGIRNDGSSTLTITGGPSNASGGQIDLTPSGIVSLVATGGQFIQFYTGGAQRGYVQNDGKFDWLGTSEFDGAMTVNSTVAATSFNSTSSRKYKTNIRNLTNGLNIINNLRPVMFDWNNKDIKNDIGMIAEEVNEILPTIVYKNSNGEIDGLEYGKLVAVLTTAVKELSAEVQELKRQINELKK